MGMVNSFILDSSGIMHHWKECSTASRTLNNYSSSLGASIRASNTKALVKVSMNKTSDLLALMIWAALLNPVH